MKDTAPSAAVHQVTAPLRKGAPINRSSEDYSPQDIPPDQFPRRGKETAYFDLRGKNATEEKNENSRVWLERNSPIVSVSEDATVSPDGVKS
jgi:hypothetical protein